MEDHRRRRRLLTRLAAFTVLVAAGDMALITPTLPARLDTVPLTAAQIEHRVTKGTVEVMSLQCDLTLNHGTGIAVGTDRVLTNQHVVGSPRVVDLAADVTPVARPTTIRTSAGADLGVVDVDAMPVTPLPLAPDDPEPGERVWLAGYPHDGPNSTSKGLIVEPAKVLDYVDGRPMAQPGDVLRLDTAARPGMSGGPVLDAAGRVVGMVFGVQTTTGDSLVLPVSLVRTALGAPMVAPPRC
ncbi:MAG TPA: serine protease [Acidimicrobiales bacterium]|nr:serine protease [Acidimicrobiales bacterium]